MRGLRGENAMSAVSPTRSALTYAVVLDGLRRVLYREVVRYRQSAPFEAFAEMGFIAWVRQPVRLSQQVSDWSRHVPAPVDVAELTESGRAAMEWLVALEAAPQWDELRARIYEISVKR